MKKIGIYALAGLGLLSASCNKESNGTVMTQTNVYNAYSLVIPSTGDATVCKTAYSFVFDLMKNNCTVKCEDLVVGGSTTSFNTSDVPYYTAMMTVDNRNSQVVLVTGKDAGEDVKNLRAEITQSSVTNNTTLLNSLVNQISSDPLSLPTNRTPSTYLYMQYNLGTTVVRTFWNDLLFEGTTKTEYPGEGGNYDTNSITYRVKMKLDGSDGYKADVYFYNAKFAEQAPAVNFVLQDLDLKFDANGYSISAKDAVPVLVPENTPFPRFTFNSFRLQSNPTMNQISCTYTVADVYSGSFGGTCYTLVPTNGI